MLAFNMWHFRWIRRLWALCCRPFRLPLLVLSITHVQPVPNVSPLWTSMMDDVPSLMLTRVKAYSMQLLLLLLLSIFPAPFELSTFQQVFQFLVVARWTPRQKGGLSFLGPSGHRRRITPGRVSVISRSSQWAWWQFAWTKRGRLPFETAAVRGRGCREYVAPSTAPTVICVASDAFALLPLNGVTPKNREPIEILETNWTIRVSFLLSSSFPLIRLLKTGESVGRYQRW